MCALEWREAERQWPGGHRDEGWGAHAEQGGWAWAARQAGSGGHSMGFGVSSKGRTAQAPQGMRTKLPQEDPQGCYTEGEGCAERDPLGGAMEVCPRGQWRGL